MTSWIFTVNDIEKGKQKTTALDVYKKRMQTGFWGLEEHPQNKNIIREGDQVIFYLAGRNNHKFVGSAILASGFLPKEEYTKKCNNSTAKFGVFLKEPFQWPEAISIKPILDKLTLTKGIIKWGYKLHLSIIPLDQVDYETIVSLSALPPIRELVKNPPNLHNDNYPKISFMNKKVLDLAFQRDVRENYSLTCTVCNKKRMDRLGHHEVQSCHIYPREMNGSNDPRNGLALCHLHHWAFDKGLFTINDDYTIRIEDRIKDEPDYHDISRYSGKKIFLPTSKEVWPHKLFLQAHRKLHKFTKK